MTTDLTDQEKILIHTKILEKYARAAVTPAGSFNYPTGVPGLRQLGYLEDWWRDFPTAQLESFCGVGNPFSLGPLRPGETVLDIGCGAGFDVAVAAHLVGQEGRVVGMDISPDMVSRAWELSALLPFRNLSFQVASAESLPFPARFFDVVTSNGAFNLVIDKDQAAQEIFRVLKPGGRLHLSDMVLVAPLPPDRTNLIDNWYQWVGGAMPGEALLALLQKAGFEQVKLAGYTGMKSSPYTEGALLSAAKPGLGLFRETAESPSACPEPAPSPQPGGSCEPGGT